MNSPLSPEQSSEVSEERIKAANTLEQLNDLALRIPNKYTAQEVKRSVLQGSVKTRAQEMLKALHQTLAKDNSVEDIDKELEDLEGRLTALKELGVEFHPSFFAKITNYIDSFASSAIKAITPSEKFQKTLHDGYDAVKDVVLGLWKSVTGISLKNVISGSFMSFIASQVENIPGVGKKISASIVKNLEGQEERDNIAIALNSLFDDQKNLFGSTVYFNRNITLSEMLRLKQFSSPATLPVVPVATAAQSITTKLQATNVPLPAINASQTVTEKALSVALYFLKYMKEISSTVEVKQDWADSAKGITLTEMLNVYELQIQKKPAA